MGRLNKNGLCVLFLLYASLVGPGPHLPALTRTLLYTGPHTAVSFFEDYRRLFSSWEQGR